MLQQQIFIPTRIQIYQQNRRFDLEILEIKR